MIASHRSLWLAESQLATARHAALVSHPRPLPAPAWAGLAKRLTVASLQLGGETARKLLDLAYEAWDRARRAPVSTRRHELSQDQIVQLDDGSLGRLVGVTYDEVHVMHDHLTLGCGPWIMHRCQVRPASAAQVRAYVSQLAVAS